jgi:thioredoxin 1
VEFLEQTGVLMLKQSTATLLLIVPLLWAASGSSSAAPQASNKLLLAKKQEKVVVTWQNSLQSAFELAKKEGRENVFAHIGTAWCIPCRFLEKHVFPDPKVQEFLANNYVNVALDGDTPEGAELLHKYQMRGFPAFFVFDKNGKLKGSFSGAPRDAQSLIGSITKMTNGQLISR